MIGVAVGLYELKIKSLILTRRGGTDVNVPASPQIAFLRACLFGFVGPYVLESLGNWRPQKIKQMAMNCYGSRISQNEQ